MAHPVLTRYLVMRTSIDDPPPPPPPPPPPGSPMVARLAAIAGGDVPLSTVFDSRGSTPPTDSTGAPAATIDRRVYAFGDGSPAVTRTDDATVSHTYTVAGDYTGSVTLTASDGSTATESRRIAATSTTTTGDVSKPSTIDGGGTANGGAVSSRGEYVGGGDVFGLFHSANGGRLWKMANDALTKRGHEHAIGIAFHPRFPHICYYLCTGSIFRSDQGGKPGSWTRQGGGTLDARIAGSNRPRQSGHMVWIDPAGDGGPTQRLLLGTQDGVMLSKDNGKTTALWSLADVGVTGIAGDPNNSNRVFVVANDSDGAAAKAGFYDWTGAQTSNTATGTGMVSHPSLGRFKDAQDVVAVKLPGTGATRVWIAAGEGASGEPDGIWFYNPANGIFTDQTDRAIMPRGTRVCAVDALPLGSEVMLYCGMGSKTYSQPASNKTPSGFRNMYRSLNTGATWDFTTRDSQTFDSMYDVGGEDHWGHGAMNDALWHPSSICINPANPDQVMVFGKGGARVTNKARQGTAADASGVEWFPAMRGIGAVAVRGISSIPGAPAKMWATANDFGSIASSEGFRTRQPKLVKGGGGFSSFTDEAGIGYYGDGPNNPSSYHNAHDIDIISSTNPIGDAGWAGEGFRGGWDGVGVFAWGTGASRRVLGYFRGSQDANFDGLQLIVGARGGSKTWSHIGLANTTDLGRVAIVRNPGTGNIYVYIPTHGIWRSNNANGTAWTKVHNLTGDAGAEATKGDLAICRDPTDDILYVTSGTATGSNRVRRFARAQDMTTSTAGVDITPEATPAVTEPRLLVVAEDDSALWVACSSEGTRKAELWRSKNQGTSWTKTSDDAYAGMSVLPMSMHLAGGYIYVGSLATGMSFTPA